MPKNTEANYENQVRSSQNALTALLRTGAQRLIAQAVEREVEQMLAEHKDITTITGHRAVVRNGFLPQRQILAGIGEIDVRVPELHDRSGNGVKFTLRFCHRICSRGEHQRTASVALHAEDLGGRHAGSAHSPGR